MNNVDKLSRLMRETLKLRREWSEDASQLAQDVSDWERENGTGDAFWHILLLEMAFAERQKDECRSIATGLMALYEADINNNNNNNKENN